MAVTVTTLPSTFSGGVHRGNVHAFPSTDHDFRTFVAATLAALGREQDWDPAAVEQLLRASYPDAALVPADALAALGPDRVYYAFRDCTNGAGRPRRVLVVDDDPAAGDIVTSALERERFEVRSAANGWEAFAVIAAWPPDVILLDLAMQGMSGEEFAEQYRAVQPPRAPIVVVSVAHDAPSRALRMEARSVVPKPFDLDLLARLVDRYA